MQRRFILKFAAALLSASLFSGAAHAEETIKVGVTGGPHAQIMEIVKQIAAKNGLKITVVEFSDYVQPNATLTAGDLDTQTAISICRISIGEGSRLQADPHRRYGDVSDGHLFEEAQVAVAIASARVAVPNDPTNGRRTLLLLQKQGLIKLRPDAGLKATALDITDNPKKLKIVELDAAQITRSLADVDAAAINTNFAMEAGLKPKSDAIAIGDPHGPYVNIIAIRAADKDKPWVAKLVSVYHSPEVKQFVESKFAGAVITAW